MNDFWRLFGQKYCKENDLIYIDKSDCLEAGDNQLDKTSLVIICLDKSYSMRSLFGTSKFDNAVKGAKEAVKFLKDNHTNPDNVQL